MGLRVLWLLRNTIPGAVAAGSAHSMTAVGSSRAVEEVEAAGRRHEEGERWQEEELIVTVDLPDGSDGESSHAPASCRSSV